MFFWWCLIVAFGDTTVLSSVLQFQGVVFMSVASSACLRYVEQPVQFFLHRCAFSGRAAELRAQSINCVTPCVCGHRALLCKHKAKCFRKQSLQVVKLEVEKHHSRRQNEVLKSFSCSHFVFVWMFGWDTTLRNILIHPHSAATLTTVTKPQMYCTHTWTVFIKDTLSLHTAEHRSPWTRLYH